MMKLYDVYEYHARNPFSKSFYTYRKIDGIYQEKGRKGGVIVFPCDIPAIDSPKSSGAFAVGRCFRGRLTADDGSLFSEQSLCLDLKDMMSWKIMMLARSYSRQMKRTVLLKEYAGRRLFSVRFNYPDSFAKMEDEKIVKAG